MRIEVQLHCKISATSRVSCCPGPGRALPVQAKGIAAYFQPRPQVSAGAKRGFAAPRKSSSQQPGDENRAHPAAARMPSCEWPAACTSHACMHACMLSCRRANIAGQLCTDATVQSGATDNLIRQFSPVLQQCRKGWSPRGRTARQGLADSLTASTRPSQAPPRHCPPTAAWATQMQRCAGRPVQCAKFLPTQQRDMAHSPAPAQTLLL